LIEFTVGRTKVAATFGSGQSENESSSSSATIDFAVQPHAAPLACVLGEIVDSVLPTCIAEKDAGPDAVRVEQAGDVRWLRIAPAQKAVSFTLHFRQTSGAPAHGTTPDRAGAERPLWPPRLKTRATLSSANDAYVVDDIALPLDNPWKRNIRLADIAFFKGRPGEAAAIAFDGDVWLLSGLSGELREVTWRRFASGLHEPMSLCIRDEEIFVFDRNGIWKLRDTDGDGEADVHEVFCNRFAQTAETREFPNSMKLAPDGSFVISKGGQQGTTLGKHNGTVIRVSADGKKFDVLGWGLRQPFVGVNQETGLVTASDQEGNYTPTTPLQIIRDHQYYGFLSELQPREQYPQTIAEPLTWIPHPVNASGATQAWLFGAKMGAVDGEMIHVGYNKPELFRVLMNSRFAKPQAAVVPWIQKLDFPPLNAAVNPADGQLYVTGFQVWGTTATRISGLARIRHTGAPRVLLKQVTPMDKGLLLVFTLPLDKSAATDPANYSIERWNYRRTHQYGSPHLKLDGTPGQEWMQPSSAYLSADGKSVFVGVPDMKPGVMQMRIGWGIAGASGLPARNSAYFTPYELANFEPEKEGFGSIAVDLTPRKVAVVAEVKPTREEGERVYQMMGCVACHSVDGTLYGKVGPTWKGLYGSSRPLAKGGKSSKADDAYLRESIVDPAAKVVKGFEKFDTGMPIYSGVLTPAQIESVILFIKSLK
jgi:mono/diheme cytochrome c family protein